MQIQIMTHLKQKKSTVFCRALALLLAVVCLFSLVSCDGIMSGTNSGASNPSGSSGGSGVTGTRTRLTYNTKGGFSIFNDSNADMDIYFFDVNNVTDEKGESYTETLKMNSDHIASADCYMIVCGDVEILVDAGVQTSNNYAATEDNCQKNLLPKIASLMSDDGILDYLIVTHADFDHISSLAVSNTIFDAFYNEESVTPLGGDEDEALQLAYIKTIIDFDSDLVKEASDLAIIGDENKLLIATSIYDYYCDKRDMVISKAKQECDEAAYVPAATLFTAKIPGTNKTISRSNKDFSFPDNVGSKDVVKKASSQGQYDLDRIGGQLVAAHIDPNKSGYKNERYYYEIDIGDQVYLRMLYNWYYDYIVDKKEYSSQDANNISVCFQVVAGDFTFMSLGDLGGDGENGLLNYYRGTDVLENVTCYKASHHGSTNNGENSAELFAEVSPDIVVITGVAVGDKQIGSGSRVVQDKDFFNAIPQGAMVLCTNVASKDAESGFLTPAPFYGDIRVSVKKSKVTLSRSYIGEVKACTTGEEMLTFQTIASKTILSLKETEWFKTFFKFNTETKGEEQ